MKKRIQWLAVLAVTCLLAGPALAAQGKGNPLGDASFDLNTAARLATSDDDGRTHVRFVGDGTASVSADGVSLELGVFTQTDGDRTLTVTPDGEFKRLGRSRNFIGNGSAVVDLNGELTEFANVRIMVKLRGAGDRMRMIGKIRGKNGPHADTDSQTPPDILNAVFRGQRVVEEPAPE
jgi:hypothetical protein